MIANGDHELASIDSIQAELQMRHAEIYEMQRKVRSEINLSSFGQGNLWPQDRK